MKPKMRLRTLMVGFATTLASRNATNFHKEKDRVRASLPSRTMCIIPKFPSLWAAQNQKVKNASSRRLPQMKTTRSKTTPRRQPSLAQSVPNGRPISPSSASYPTPSHPHPKDFRTQFSFLAISPKYRKSQRKLPTPTGTDPISSKPHFIKCGFPSPAHFIKSAEQITLFLSPFSPS